MKVKPLFFLFFIVLFSFSADAAPVPLDISGGMPKVDLPALVQECPNFASYPGYNGVIWQKNSSYKVDGGGISVTRVVVLLGKTGIDKKWLEWEIKIPDGGRAEIFQSAIFDPGSLSEVQKIVPQKNIDHLKVSFAPKNEEFLLVLTYKQTYSGQLALRDFFWLSDELPIWEQTITASVGRGDKLEHRTNTDVEPKAIAETGGDVYTWLFVNQLPEAARSLRTDTRPWLAFGGGKQGYEGLVPASEVEKGKASANRLSVTMNLNLSDEWTMTGSANIVLRGAWRAFMPENFSPRDIVREIFGQEKIFAGNFEAKESKGALEISAPLKPSKVIIGTKGGNAIVPLPVIQPLWLMELEKTITPYNTRFPMTIEANYRVEMPPRMKEVFLPQKTDIGMGDIKYSEKYLLRKRRVDLDMDFSTRGTKIDAELDRDIRAAVYRWGTQKNIPITVK